ncbi:hypothetical protein CRG98_023614 [Punica granatum]|uniref:Uncharacterized protein n=1 Tax=Punica granatum TaxID=22663 RepID=A0A2I0JKB3_PUNGR|nr:hypothetical protein CRG98_023614 [Punica granatum]
MNFLLRSPQPAASELPPVNESSADANHVSKPVTTLEGLISEDPFPRYEVSEDNGESDGVRSSDGILTGPSSTADVPIVDKHSDVSEEEGWITIPCKELPADWKNALDIRSLRSLNRSFVFPGEQVHILACLSANEQETEIITPFRVAAVMSKNGIRWSPKKENGDVGAGRDSVSGNVEVHDKEDKDQSNESPSQGKTNHEKDMSAGESLLRKEDQKLKTETLLQRFNNSHFFVRIAESGDKLWSKKGVSDKSLESSDTSDQISATSGNNETLKDSSGLSAIIDKGNFKANASGGVARGAVQCCALANGDLVVLLQINVGVDLLRDPIIEILQFEKYQAKSPSLENQEDAAYANGDPCKELLTWLLPLENTVLPPVRPLSPPTLASVPGIGSTSQRSNFSAASGSQIFSFGNFRSYSMSSIPQNPAAPPTPTAHSSKSTSLDLDDWDRVSKQKPLPGKRIGKEGLLSFRTVSLEPERFSVCCGLEGIYTPGKRWRRKLEIIQPIEIQSFAAECNTDDLLCVQIKNVCPAHIPDIVMYIDAITIVLEEAAKGGPPVSFPIASIEPGEDYSLPNLALRRGEEHSFIIKPAISAWKKLDAQDRRSAQSSSSTQTLIKNTSSLRVSSKIVEEKNISSTDHYAIMVSCHSNHTESRLFFKKPTSWRPRISRDIMISVASEISRESPGPNTQLPVQVLTLQASNMTSEDLTMTILAPASFTSPPSIVSLNSSPTSPISPVMGLTEFNGKLGSSMQKPPAAENQKKNASGELRSVSVNEQGSPMSDAILNTDLGCTHLWLQSRVPLGRVPSQTTATIKLELLPLTDGIITLDTLQVDVKEKGRTYIPEHSLKINATSSISTGII